MSLNWDDIRYFLALCRKNSFVAAANELRVTHSTVARRITTLESSLQTLLFHRNEKGCTVTPAGEKLVVFAEQIESTILNIEESVSGYNNQLSGSIRIGAPDGIGNCYLATCLGRLQTRHPSLNIELVAVPMYYSLAKHEIDILITVKKPTVGNVIVRKLTDYKLGMFANQQYLSTAPPITHKKDLKKHQIVSYVDDLLFDSDLQFMEEITPGLTSQFRCTTVVAQMTAVASGAGIGVIPYFMAHQEERIVPVLPTQIIERGYWLQVNPESRQLARVRATIDFLVEQINLEKNIFLTLPDR